MKTLFGHLVTRFGSQQAENLATEGLHYILNESADARKIFVRLLEQSGMTIDDDLHFITQDAKDDGAIPDLVGIDASGQGIAIIESKFWAGLTSNQPTTYLSRLGDRGILLFIAPAARFESLWPELLHRCRETGVAYERNIEGKDWRCVRLAHGPYLALASWRSVLDILHQGLIQAGDTGRAADVHQLSGLANQMDTTAFLPITSEELSPAIGRRVVQFCQLVDDVVYRLKSLDLADLKGCKSTGGKHGTYLRYFRMHNCGCCLHYDPPGWAERGVPFTLKVGDPAWRSSPEINEIMRPLEHDESVQAIVLPQWGSFVPLRVKLNAEKEEVVKSLVDQIFKVAERIRGVHSTATPSNPPADDLLPELPLQ